nr:TIGR01620 family protein [Rhodovulum sp. ES.010]
MERDRAEQDRAARAGHAAAAGKAKSPRVFDTEDGARAQPSPATAPPVPDLEADGAPPPEGRAMQTLAALGARRPSRLARLFWSSLLALVGFMVSVAAWDFVTGLLQRNTILGGIALTLVGLVLLALLLVMIRELAAFARLRRLDALHQEANAAIASHDLAQARAVFDHLMGFYAHRDDTAWARERLAERRDEVLDADALLGLFERELLRPLDAAATREIETAARTVAAVTAIVPITLADLVGALTANLRMIRRVAEIYGGRGGLLGSIRLARAVLTHLVATGAVAVGDDMIGSIAGGGMLARVSRRFGEGIVNGALTARVGVAAMEVCRPLPFREGRRPSVSALVKRALTGVFSKPES